MTLRVRLHPAAARELREAIAWYENQSAGLRRIVVVELRRVIERIRLFPEAYRKLRPGVRQATLARLPLAIIYSPTPEAIVILAVAHSRRDPSAVNQSIGDRTGN